jgi:hypothetical protein
VVAMEDKYILNIWDNNIVQGDSIKEAGWMSGIRGGHSHLFEPPQNVRWVKKQLDFNEHTGITVFTDKFFRQDVINGVNSPIKVGMILEPIAHDMGAYNDAQDVEHLLDFIFTFNKQLLEGKDPQKWKFMSADWTSMERQSYSIHKKTKLVSFMHSTKTALDRGLRHTVVQKYGNLFDLFNNVDLKSSTLKDYKFSIAMENSLEDYYFTEKILDCFISGNLTIYRGAFDIDKFFDKRGILTWNTLDELETILKNINKNEGLYDEMLPFVHTNYNIACNYIEADDRFYDTLKKCLIDKEYNTFQEFLRK